jgi:hypothetical protein
MKKWTLLVGVALVLVAVVATAPAVLAQGPGSGYGPGDGTGPVDDGAFGPGYGSGSGAFGPRFGRGMGGGMYGVGGPENSLIAVAAEVLGIEPAELVAELQDGASIAEVAGTQVDAIVEAFVASRTERLEELVDSGRLTQEEADIRLATMESHVADRLSQPWSPQGRGLGTPGAGFIDEDGDAFVSPRSGGTMEPTTRTRR